LILPQGAQGPAFLVSGNYRVILNWNRSMFYAIAVGHLADRLVGRTGLSAPHRNDPPLAREDMLALQDGLHRLGFLKADPDGVVGASTREAIRAFQRANGLPPDGYADAAMVQLVAARSAGRS
jgi:membrane-bound lytic murein transglycosylase B